MTLFKFLIVTKTCDKRLPDAALMFSNIAKKQNIVANVKFKLLSFNTVLFPFPPTTRFNKAC